MERKEPNARFRKNVRAFYAYIGSLIFAALAPIMAGQMIDSHGVALRAVGVALGTLGWVPIMLFTAYLIRRGDEFTRRMHLVALAWSFAGALLLISIVDWLFRAEFIPVVPYMVLWLAIALLWVVALFTTKWYYERPE